MCVGPYHSVETREWEKSEAFREKSCFSMGPPLDKLLLLAGEHEMVRPKSDPIPVLVAPSWGAEGIMETRGKEIIINLISKGYNVIETPSENAPNCTKNYSRSY